VTRFRLAQGILRAELEGEEVVLNPGTGEYHLLNPTGRRALLLAEEGLDLDAIVERITMEFAQDASHVETDLLRFVDAMRDRALIELSP
jgi:hypothetical protein